MSRISGIRTHFTWNPPSIASNGVDDETFTVKGAALGDFVFVAADIDVQGMTMYAHVSAPDTISIHLHNPKGGSVDLGEMRIHVTVVKEGIM